MPLQAPTSEFDPKVTGGEAGVAKAIDLIRNEMAITMGLCGVNTIAEIDDHVLAI
jgi:L-lactate dehydrogenase (cytochrome)